MDNDTAKKFNLPSNFPIELLKNGVSLEEQGIKELAWKFEDVIRVIEFLTSNGYAVLGGDVYESRDGQIEPTADSWYLNCDNIKVEEYLSASKVKALSYVREYNNNHKNDNYLYVVVYKNYENHN